MKAAVLIGLFCLVMPTSSPLFLLSAEAHRLTALTQRIASSKTHPKSGDNNKNEDSTSTNESSLHDLQDLQAAQRWQLPSDEANNSNSNSNSNTDSIALLELDAEAGEERRVAFTHAAREKQRAQDAAMAKADAQAKAKAQTGQPAAGADFCNLFSYDSILYMPHKPRK